MGLGAGSRVVQGTIAAAAAVLASATATTVDVIPEKLHLKVTPILFHAVPVSMPLPPLASLSGACGCSSSGGMASPLSVVSYPRVLKDLATPPSLSSHSPPSPSSVRPPYYVSPEFSLAQGGGSVSMSSSSSQRPIGHMLPVFLSTSIVAPTTSQVSMMGAHSVLTTAVKFPELAPFCFSTSGLYAAPVTEKHVVGFRSWKKAGNDVTSLPYYSVLQAQTDAPVILAKLGSDIAQTPHSSNYLDSLLSSLLSFQSSNFPYSSSSPQETQSLHTWLVPNGEISRGLKDGGRHQDFLEKKPVLTVVLLGWLGAQQKHLKKYAEWYNARGIHAVTFVIPMADLLSLKGHGNAEEHVDSLASHLAQYLSDESDLEGEKQLIFHTFSNTGWLTYGAILEKMQKQGEHLLERIKGCVIDSAPVPDPDPQVWASGFSAALLKKRSSATKPALLNGEVKEGVSMEAATFGSITNLEVGGANSLETAVLSVLEGFFSLFLKLPAINRRLSELVTVLQKKQPSCPQLYIYSTADKVIPVKAVEAFIEEQRKTGRVVRACNLQTSPHVDHFRSYPQLYSEQLISFLKEVLPSAHAQTDAV